MGVNLDRSRLLQVVVYAIVVDTAYEAVMDADDVLHSIEQLDL